MFALLLRLKRRIKKLLKVQTESRQTPVTTARSRTVKILILLVTSIGISVLYPGEVIYDPLDMPRAGEFASEDIIAPFQFTVYKSDSEMRNERSQARQVIPYVLNSEASIVAGSLGSLRDFATLVDSFNAQDSLAKAAGREAMFEFLAQRFPMMGQGALTRTLTEAVDIRAVSQTLERIYTRQIYRDGVLSNLAELPESRNQMVIIHKGDGSEEIRQRSRIKDVHLAYGTLLTTLNQLAAKDSIDVDLYYQIGINFIQPNLSIDMAEYNRRVDEALEDVSNVKEIVNAGDPVVFARKKVSQEQTEVLQEMARIMRKEAASRGPLIALLPMMARIVLVLATFTALYLFLYYFRSDLYKSNPKLLALFLIFGLQILLVYLIQLSGLSTIYLWPVAVLPVMVTILYDAEVGILSTVVLALLLGILHRFSFGATLLTSVVGIVACLTSQNVRKRSDFYRITFAVVLAYIVLIAVVENLKLSPNEEILTEMLYGSVVSVLSIFLVMGMLPVFESIFGITTDTTLLELSDLNHPLLKRLSIEAPGTYHHSISVGNLSESAAEAIGGNALLARVGAYYHDIGKVEIPEYFVENQFSVRSKHESLTPSMSSLILSSHVKKGRLLGEEADIPDVVLNFIEEHHGTMVMSYFYHKAREQGDNETSIDKFRYPGPKPQMRETGIVMLADAVEAASRTLDDPKPARIDSLIERIIHDRFESGELSDCPLTLRDLAGIREAFAQVLIAAFHHRVRYPSGGVT